MHAWTLTTLSDGTEVQLVPPRPPVRHRIGLRYPQDDGSEVLVVVEVVA
jgi:hypothetical protein